MEKATYNLGRNATTPFVIEYNTATEFNIIHTKPHHPT